MSNYQILGSSSSPGGSAVEFIDLQTGTSPIAPSANTITFNGAVVAAGTHPVRTDGTGASTMALEVQISQAIASTNASNIGLAAFNSAQFSVDANGFVSLSGAAGTDIGVDAHTAPGTNPVVPLAGVINFTGAQVAAGVVGTNVIRTDSTVANQVTIEIQRTTAVFSSAAVNNGVAHFSSTDFQVDANGFVQLANSLNGSGTTTGATTANLITLPLGATPGTYQFEARAVAFNASTPASSGFNIYSTFRTDGVTATLVGNQDIFNEDPALAPADAYFIASGNSAILQVLGVAGLSIDWVCEAKLTIST